MSLAQRVQDRGFDSDDSDEDARPLRERLLDKENGPLAGLGPSALLLRLRVFFGFCRSDIRSRPGTFCLGLFSCLMVVFVTALMMTAIANMPLVFLRIAENTEGQRDLILTAGGELGKAKALNYTMIKSAFSSGDHQYNTMRAVIDGLRFFSVAGCVARGAPGLLNDSDTAGAQKWDPTEASIPAAMWENRSSEPDPECRNNVTGCVASWCAEPAEGDLLAIDFEREKAMGVGRQWQLPAPPRGGVILPAEMASTLGVGVGSDILVAGRVDSNMLGAFEKVGVADGLSPPYTQYGRSGFRLRVDAVSSDSEGKTTSDAEGLSVFMSAVDLLAVVGAGLEPKAPAGLRAAIADVNVEGCCASQVMFNLPPERRMGFYNKADVSDMVSAMAKWASPLVARVGFNQVSVQVPILGNLQSRQIFSLFLNLILMLIIVGLGILCIVLVHALLTVGVASRTFELAVMRMVGMTRPQLVGYVVMGAALFAIPAWALGLALAQGAFIGVRSGLQGALGVKIHWPLTGDAIGYATLFGFGFPAFGALAPIRSVLALDLPAALDAARGRGTSGMIVKLRRPGAAVVNWTRVGLGLLLSVLGFGVYYLFPLALVQFNISLLLYLFFGLLFGMMFGLVLLSVNFERTAETMVSYAFLWWENGAVFDLVRSNLAAHRQRNRQTTMMFAMAVGFVVFIAVLFGVELQSTVFGTRRQYGGIVQIRTGRGHGHLSTYAAVEESLLALQSDSHPELRWTYALRTPSVYSVRGPQNASVDTVGRYAAARANVHAVPPGFYDVLDNGFLGVEQRRPSRWSLSESLYSANGSGRALLASGAATDMARQSLDDDYVLSFDVRAADARSRKARGLLNSEALIDSSSFLSSSRFPRQPNQMLSVSIPSLLQRGAGSFVSFEDIDIMAMCVVAGSDESEETANLIERSARANVLRRGAPANFRVRKLPDFIREIGVANRVLMFFFIFTQATATVVCFFALAASMGASIHEQAKTIGVLRAIGITPARMTRVAVWEAFVLVTAASLLGTVVGVVMAYAATMQRALFTQLPLPVVFPWIQLIIMLTSAALCAFLASFGPIRALMASGPVTHLIRKSV